MITRDWVTSIRYSSLDRSHDVSFGVDEQVGGLTVSECPMSSYVLCQSRRGDDAFTCDNTEIPAKCKLNLIAQK